MNFRNAVVLEINTTQCAWLVVVWGWNTEPIFVPFVDKSGIPLTSTRSTHYMRQERQDHSECHVGRDPPYRAGSTWISHVNGTQHT